MYFSTSNSIFSKSVFNITCRLWQLLHLLYSDFWILLSNVWPQSRQIYVIFIPEIYSRKWQMKFNMFVYKKVAISNGDGRNFAGKVYITFDISTKTTYGILHSILDSYCIYLTTMKSLFRNNQNQPFTIHSSSLFQGDEG